MSEEGVKTCISCLHFVGQENEIYNPHMRPGISQGPECKHPAAQSRDPIYGKALCLNERATNKGCGKKGRLWEPKKPA